MFYIFQNIYFNHARCICDHSASLNGTGWAISKTWVDTNGFHAKTITEDLESIAWFSTTNTKVTYIHQAITYDEYPRSISLAFHQLQRWIFGQLQCGRFYTKQLCKELFHKRNGNVLDPLLVYNMTFFVELLLILLIVILIWKPDIMILRWIHHNFLLCITVAYIVLMTLGLCGTVKSGYSVRKYIWGIIGFPIFIVCWAPILVSVQFRKNVTWTQIPHTDVTRIEDHK